MKSKKIILDIKGSKGAHKRPHMHVPSGDCCRNHMVVVPGTGDRDFKFPPVQELVIRALNRLSKPVEVEETDDNANPTEGSDGTDNGGKEQTKKLTVVTTPGNGRRSRLQTRKVTVKYEHLQHTFVPGLPTEGAVPVPLLPRPIDSGKGNGATLFTAAQALREIMDEGRFDAIIADRFDPLAGAVNWARLHMEERFQGAIESLNGQLLQLRVLYKDALPRVLTVLAAQNPDVPEQMLLQVAVQVLDEELAQILTVLRIWTDAFAQHRDQMYEQLGAVRQLVEESYLLFRGEALDGDDKGMAKKANVHTTVFQVGNVFVARFGHLGPATLPAKGPIGAHAIEVPMDERNIITLMLPLYAHEFRHDVFHDVVGLEDDVREAVAKAIVEAYEKGELKFSQEFIKLGRQKVKTIDLLVKFFADTIGEVDADISGGVLLTGVSFLYLVILSFSAFNAKGRTVESTPRLLRSASYFELVPDEKTGAVSLEFFPHPPDYIRAHIVAAALDEIGFKAEGDECRSLADIACGDPLPEKIKWFDASGKSKLVIEIPVADIKAVAPVIAKALIRTPLKSLGDVATGDILVWNRKRQAKVDKLAELLMQGKSDVPEELGDVYATYVAAAAALAYWGAVGAGRRAKLHAVPMIEKNALAMLSAIRERRQLPATVADAGDAHASCVHHTGEDNGEEVNPLHKPAPMPAADGAPEGVGAPEA